MKMDMLLSAVVSAALIGSGLALTPTVEITQGVHMPRVNLGTCCGSKPSVGLAPWLKAGGVGIDTAWDYHDEQDIGAVLRKANISRSDVFITTKIPAGIGASHGNTTDCSADSSVSLRYVQDNLLQLGVDYVDLVLLHGPCEMAKPAVKDPKASNQALWEGLEAALASGVTRAIGVSNYDHTRLAALSGTVPAVNQAEMSLTGSFGQPGHDDATIAYCQQHNITYESYGALKGCPFTNPTVKKIATAHGVSPASVCLRWVLQRGAVVATGTGNDTEKSAVYAKSDLAVIGSLALSSAEMTDLNQLQQQHE